MTDWSQRSFPVTERSLGAAVRRDVHQLALGLPLSVRQRGELDIVVAELVSNLIKHAQRGELLVRLLPEQTTLTAGSDAGRQDVPAGLELIALDHGPGMTNPGQMLQDGVSTTRTLGHGLGTINRLSNTFQLYSSVSWGTILLFRLFTEPPPVLSPVPPIRIGSVVLPKPGQTACGDGYAVIETPDHVALFLGDGLGHGPLAEVAVQRALGAFRQQWSGSPAELLKHIHDAVKDTRGLVGTVVVLDRKNNIWRLCGVGNISARISNARDYTEYSPHNGIIGNNMPASLVERTIAVEPDQQVILNSDGLNARWSMAPYAGMFKYDPSVLAAALYRDQARRTDDLAVVVGRLFS